MAAACQQTSSSGSNYEVFLSFNGKDVRTNFADHLYLALVGAGIRTFRDDEELTKGEKIAPNLLAAIQQSIISIPILSMNYGSSKWCLDELKEICECKRMRDQTVLPIFYKIEPRDVRNQTGEYAKAFDEVHPKHFDQDTVQKWREVLQEIGRLDGWHIKEGLHEGKFVTQIVKVVSSTLNKSLFHDSDKLVGIGSHIEEMLKLLDIESEVTKIVGIHGFGGTGKTTIARASYNRILSKFEEYAFIENVREDAENFGIQYLQNKLLKSTLKDGSPNINDAEAGIKVIQERLSTKRVLVVLDDVDKDIQIESLIGNGKWFGNGSRIIITSRDKNILVTQTIVMYEPSLMNLDDSLELFSRYAFKGDHPQEDYLDLSKAMVEVIGGLPLALKIIGSSLFSKMKSVWEDTLKKLQKVLNDDVMERLKISYNGLGHAEKQMFLDTACFFIGMKKDFVCYIWESCDFFPQIGLDVLCAKSLVTINEDDELRMHDVLRDLGRELVRRESVRPEERSRIWSKEEALDVFVKRQGTNKCVGLTIDFKRKTEGESLMSEALDAMTELRLLQLDYAQLLGNSRNSFSELRWLSWKACCSKSCSKLRRLSWKERHGPFALTNFYPKKLVVLDLSWSEMTEKWMGWNYIKMALNLRVLKLEHCWGLRSTPDFSGNPLLKVLSLNHCGNLERVHPSIGYLRKLVTLDMTHCTKIVDLPIETCDQLASLETLILYGCWYLKRLPDKLDHIPSLTTLHISGEYDVCPSLPARLTNVILNGCGSLQDIPTLPQSLITLEVSRCGSLQNITLGFLPSLTSLTVSHCHSAQNISGLPSSLRSLLVEYCYEVVKISSASEGGLTDLKTLILTSCSSLEEIEVADGKLESLEHFEIWGSVSFKRLPKLRCSKNLLSLKISWSNILSDFEGEGMDSLEELKIWNCFSLKKIPYLRDSKQLRELKIESCPGLVEIERLESYETLEILRITGCENLTNIHGIERLKNLKTLWIDEDCYLQDLSNSENLEEVNVS